MDKVERLQFAYNSLRLKGVCKSQKDFANLLGITPPSISKAMNGDPKYLTDNLLAKVDALLSDGISAIPEDYVRDFTALDRSEGSEATRETIPVIPTDALAGTLCEFSSSVSSYDCERMISPIKGADFAIKVCGESMTPEYPNGSTILIKKVSGEFIEWGRCFCLDTQDGAVIKLVFPTEDPEVVECRSINPAFPPFRVRTSLINGWYRVLMCLSLK